MAVPPADMTSDYLDSLSDAAFSAFGPCRVGLLGEATLLSDRLAARGIAPRDRGSIDAWLVVSSIDRILRGDELPLKDAGHTIFVACRSNDDGSGVPLLTRVESAMISHGYIKHPANTELFGYALRDVGKTECWSLFEHRPAVPNDEDTTNLLKRERDLHSDMLREPGVRSDAHLVRYQLAATLVRPGDTVLDAACGLGYGSHILSYLSPLARITGIDVSSWAVDYASRNYASERTTFEVGLLPDSLKNFDDGSVDFVVSLETLEHVSDPQALLTAFARVLKPGGRIFVSVPNDWADESGKDPSPHHLHVYNWQTLLSQIEAAKFSVESAWSLTASGCKVGEDRGWRVQPRKLDQVSLDIAKTTDGEWWLVCASKSPLEPYVLPYINSVHSTFDGKTHLVDFADFYDRPWIVHSLVELPWRNRNKEALATLAAQVSNSSRAASADKGAGLAVLGWRILEDQGAIGPEAMQWLLDTENYVDVGLGCSNPHVRRWTVSLRYLRARFLEAQGNTNEAIAEYHQVTEADVTQITPTLGTKQADAAIRAGVLSFREGNIEAALAIWRTGLDSVFRCLRAAPIEFIGNRNTPFVFAMNDLVEMTDGATRLANAINAATTHGRRERLMATKIIGAVAQNSLRSAVRHLNAKVNRLTLELSRHHSALEEAQQISLFRLSELAELETQRANLEKAKASAENAALSHFQTVTELQAINSALQSAKNNAETLAITRHGELQQLQSYYSKMEAAKEHAEAIAIAHYQELEALRTLKTFNSQTPPPGADPTHTEALPPFYCRLFRALRLHIDRRGT